MIRKIGLVAKREIVVTVSSKGFIIGILLMPAMFALFIVLAPRILGAASPVVNGDVAIIDPTGQVVPELREAIVPDTIKERMETAAKNRMGSQNVPVPPDLKLIERPVGTDVQ